MKRNSSASTFESFNALINALIKVSNKSSALLIIFPVCLL